MCFKVASSQQVINLRARSSLGFLGAVLPACQQSAHRTAGIIQIAKHPNLRRARFHAGWQFASVYALGTKVALFHHAFVFAEKACVIGTSNDAVPATHTLG